MTVSSGGGPEGSVTSPRSRAAAATVGVAAIATAPVAAPAEANNLRRLKLSIWTPFDREPVAGTGPPSRAGRSCDNRCQPLRSTDQSGSAPAGNYAEPCSSWSSLPPAPHAGAAGLVGVLAVILLVWFAGSVRERLAAAEGGQGRLASISFAGFILFAVGGTIFSGLEFALGDVATKVPDGVVQTLSVMESDLFAPVAAGAILALFATGIASLRYGVLPAWLAWLGFVIGVVTFTPAGFFGFLAFLVWVLITSVMLYTSQDQEAAAG